MINDYSEKVVGTIEYFQTDPIEALYSFLMDEIGTIDHIEKYGSRVELTDPAFMVALESELERRIHGASGVESSIEVRREFGEFI